MTYFFSKSTRGLYLNEDHEGRMPEDAKALTQEQYDAVKDASSLGKYIEGDNDGYPVMKDVSELPAEVPQRVPMWNARRALIDAGLLAQVDTVIAAMPAGETKQLAENDWRYAQTVDRVGTLTLALGEALGLSSPEIDALFISAAAL